MGSASTPQAVTIVLHAELGGDSNFEATGAINDSGPVTIDFVHPAALPSPVVGTATYIRTYHGASGTFTMKLETLLTLTDVPWIGAEHGHWVITSGTGAYEGLQGHGREEGTRDFLANSVDLVFTGGILQ